MGVNGNIIGSWQHGGIKTHQARRHHRNIIQRDAWRSGDNGKSSEKAASSSAAAAATRVGDKRKA